jgi:hypothetical protein
MQIMPSEVDKQDLDTLLWIILSDNTEKNKELEDEDGAIMGLL